MKMKKFGGHVKQNSTFSQLTQGFSSFFVSFLASILLFQFEINAVVYLVFAAAIWAGILVSFRLQQNLDFFLTIDFIAVANLSAYVIMKTIHGRTWGNVNSVKLGLTFAYAVFLLAVFLRLLSLAHLWDDREHPLKELFPERRKDLERVEEYLHEFRSIGIEGEWGSGKTLLVNHLENEFTEDTYATDETEYIYTEIHLLSCDIDDITDVILNIVSNVLRSQRIFSRSLPQLRALLKDETWFRRLGLSFSGDGTYTDAMNSLRKELSALGAKQIVIVFEDVDRIQNAAAIRRVFSIGENLSRSSSIKLIYEYNQANLEMVDPTFSRAYVEKYIPFTVTLTDISLQRLISLQLSDVKNDVLTGTWKLQEDDFAFLYRPVPVDFFLEKLFSYHVTITVNWENFSVRQVQQFLNETQSALAGLFEQTSTNEKAISFRNDKDIRRYKCIIILFFAIKHFAYEVFRELGEDESLIDQFAFIEGNEKYSLWELIQRQQEYRKDSKKNADKQVDFGHLMDIPENRIRFAFLNMFGYKLQIEDTTTHGTDQSALNNEDAENVIAKNRNEAIDRIVWYLLASGRSNHTDMQEFVLRMDSEVCSQKEDKQQQAFSRLCEDYYYGKGFSAPDIHTVFRFGMDRYFEIFRAYRGCMATADQWKRLLNFYFRSDTDNRIDTDYLETINYCDLSNKEVYFMVLRNFLDREIVANPGNIQAYRCFLKTYIRKMASLGFTNTPEVEIIDIFEPGTILGADLLRQELFSPMKKRLELLLKDLQPFTKAVDDVRMLIDFLDKNQTLLNVASGKILRERQVKVTMNESSGYVNQSEFNRLKKIKKTKSTEKWEQEAGSSYSSGRISAYELQELMKE